MKITNHRLVTRRTRRLLVSGLLVVGFLSVPLAANASNASTSPSGNESVSPQENESAKNYWTPERMKAAKPRQPGVASGGTESATAPSERGRPMSTAPTVGSHSSAPESGQTPSSGQEAVTSEGYWQASNTANPNAQIGKLFFQSFDPASRTWKNYVCSGTVVNSENKSVVWTAGHCVFETYLNNWNRNYVFCPGYRNGSCALGQWTPYSQSTTTAWQNAACLGDGRCYQNEFQYDFGALKMNTNNGYRIANYVGSMGISFNGATVQSRYLFGYPVNKTNGQYLYYCAGTNTYPGPNMNMAPCGAGGGASGGPWLSQINGSWLGNVHSVNSNGGTGDMNGPYQGTVAANLFAAVRS